MTPPSATPPKTDWLRKARRIALFTLALFAVLGCVALWRLKSVAAIQDALERDYEINFDAGGIPRWLPPTLDRSIESLTRRAIGPQRDYQFLMEKRNRADVWQDRFRALFRGRITEIEIYYPGRLRGDLGAALARFPSLRRLKIQEADFSERDWAYVFAGLRKLPRLTELEIGGSELNERTLEPLVSLRMLSKLRITTGRVEPESAQLFARMPSLRELTFDEGTFVSIIDPLTDGQKYMRDGVPTVNVEFQ